MAEKAHTVVVFGASVSVVSVVDLQCMYIYVYFKIHT